MLCEKCGNNPANVHLSQNINGHKVSLNICQSCASKLGYGKAISPFNLDLLNILSPKSVSSGLSPCPGCGETYEQYRSTSLLGCDKCYTHFASLIDPVLKKVHGSNTHVGKLPDNADAEIKVKRTLEKLRQQLKEAIINEEYENAALIRDQIKELEGEK